MKDLPADTDWIFKEIGIEDLFDQNRVPWSPILSGLTLEG
jgi:hypothetical protein